MRADWTASGACTSGSTAPPGGATRRASGGAATTSTTSAEVGDGRDTVPWHVGGDDGGDDAAVPGPDAAALPPGRCRGRRNAPRSADRARGRRLLLRLDRVRNGRFSAGSRAGGDRDAAAGAGARRTDRGRCGRPDRRLPPAHRVEGASPCLLPGGTRAQPYAAGG